MSTNMKKLICIIVFANLFSFFGCSISVDTILLDFGSTEVTKQLTLTIKGNVKWDISCDEDWVTVNPGSGPSTRIVTPQSATITETTQEVNVTVNRAGLDPGNYEATLTISNNWNLSCPDVLIKMTVEQQPLPLVVEGYVYDADTDEPISGAIVSIDSSSDTTDESGYYGIEISKLGSKTITAQKEGYENYSADIDVEDEKFQHDIYMTTITGTTSTTPPSPPTSTTSSTTTPTTIPTTVSSSSSSSPSSSPSSSSSSSCTTSSSTSSTTTTVNTFSVVLIPDTQYYSRDYPENYKEQSRWIKENRTKRNIRFVIHLGDITQDNLEYQWYNASEAHKTLDENNIPYSVVPGNHDIYPEETCYLRDYSNLNKYFNPSRFVRNGGYLEGSQNNYTFFDYEGLQFLVISLEIAPTKEAICWANQVIEEHKYHRVIIVTHCYLNEDGTYNSGCDNSYDLIGCDGEELWYEFVSRHSNIFMVLSGHINGSIHTARSDTSYGNAVHQILTNFQEEPHGGDGWLRVLTFSPYEGIGEVKSTVLSVLGEQSLKQPDYPDNPGDHQHAFNFAYNMVSPMAKNKFDGSNFVFNDMTVNYYNSSGNQKGSRIAVAPNGNFVVVWEDDQNGHEDVYARGFFKGGCARFPQIRVNTTYLGDQTNPDVAMDSNGNFVVVWQGEGIGGADIFARGFNADGTQRFPEITVNDQDDKIDKGKQINPAVAMETYGDFVVVWQDDYDDNDYYQIYARGFIFDGSGSERFHEITVNTDGSKQQERPDVAIGGYFGNFVVVWQDSKDDHPHYDIYASGFNANGTKYFNSDIKVNDESNGEQIDPAVAVDRWGNFVAVWEDDSVEPYGVYQIYARGFKFDKSENQWFPRMTVNRVSSGDQINPAVAMDLSGNFVVVWQDDKNNNNYWQIYARGFKSNGIDDLFNGNVDINVNDNDSGDQKYPYVAMAGGSWIVAWTDNLDGNCCTEVLARGLTY